MTRNASAPPAGAPTHLRPFRWLVGVTALAVATLVILAFTTLRAHLGHMTLTSILALAGLMLLTVALASAFLLTAGRLLERNKALAIHIDYLDGQLDTRTRRLEASERALRGEVRAKDDLVAAVFEELRRPLAEVVGFASIVLDSGEEVDGSMHDLVGLILEETLEMMNVVDDLLVASKVSTGSLDVSRERVALAGEVDAVLSRWNSVEVGRVSVSGDGGYAIADAARVRQVVRNLLSNALRYGGPTIEITVSERHGRAVVTVADSGDPIAEEIQDRMFDLYYRGPGTDTGTAPSLGIGLGLSRYLAEAMGGTLEFQRAGGRNVFELRLPAAEAAEGHPRAEAV